MGFTVSSLYGSSGATGDDVDSLGNRHIVVSTPEKLDFALRNNPDLLADVGLIVLDEAHSIGAGEREIRYEVLVQRLLRRDDAVHRRIVCLSAILPQGEQLQDFVAWIRQDQPGGSALARLAFSTAAFVCRSTWKRSGLLWTRLSSRRRRSVGGRRLFQNTRIPSWRWRRHGGWCATVAASSSTVRSAAPWSLSPPLL
jgi:hypothetical protein